MANAYVEIDVSPLKDLFDKMERAAKGEARKAQSLFLESIGTEFLRILEDEIVRRKVMDTRLLLASFTMSGDGNVWEVLDGGLTLEVGTNVAYASFVNDGHWTNPKGVDRRFVPGFWKGDRFIYDPNADTGMVLKQQWVDGTFYFQGALNILEKMFPDLAEAKMQQWLDRYFGL